jgi:hypothetical protein
MFAWIYVVSQRGFQARCLKDVWETALGEQGCQTEKNSLWNPYGNETKRSWRFLSRYVAHIQVKPPTPRPWKCRHSPAGSSLNKSSGKTCRALLTKYSSAQSCDSSELASANERNHDDDDWLYSDDDDWFYNPRRHLPRPKRAPYGHCRYTAQRFTNCSASVNRHVYDKEFPPLGLPTSASAKLKLNSLPASATAKHSATRAEQVRGYVGC